MSKQTARVNERFKRLYWKISAVLLLCLLVMGVVFVFVTAYSAGAYFKETSQRLNADVAEHIVKEIPMTEGGQLDKNAFKEVLDYMMVINPSIEVYLLDPKGAIVDNITPDEDLKVQEISVEPIKEFVESNGQSFVQGQDPRNLDCLKVFSAAPIYDNGHLMGYVYVILASEEFDYITQFVLKSYILKGGTKTFLIILITSLILGLVALYFLMQNLKVVLETAARFKGGDLDARIKVKPTADLRVFANTFNEMADTISSNLSYIKSMETMRSELIANVSHDLRTPLAIMQGYIETLILKRDNISKDEATRYLHTIHGSTERLNNLVEELFEYSKLESLQVVPNMEPFVLSELASDISNKYKLLAANRGISINLISPPDLPLIFGDISLMERVLQNLIDNAIKYSSNGGSITIKLFGDRDSVKVEVADTGAGIPEHALPHIFDRYYKGGVNSHGEEGAGLGLAIVKKILEIHEAKIDVESTLGVGTRFVITFPAFKAQKVS